MIVGTHLTEVQRAMAAAISNLNKRVAGIKGVENLARTVLDAKPR
jgi:hypothetical protein